ncbi:uncharacterized protein LOC116305394 [Actinia tenebrosa]|uniref:Uncharacterized protein LOC116305394 n=1 Tax=Actinia tenebrosa TaxID=6105 RepID=A0A6P8IVN0_ACTTE|nr:uncharacterized protein LOC116305394 [Actinia tenebrosa]
MSSTIFLISLILAVCVFPFGYSLKCYTYICSNSSVGPSPSCAPPQETTCKPLHGVPMAPNRCLTQRLVLGMGDITLHQEIRNCSYSLQCQSMRDITCNAANATGILKKCEVGCCEGDLCNSGGPIPTQAPMPTGPSGADLSCMACSNIPRYGVQKDCSDPLTQTCGAGPLPMFPQDRCMSVKGLVKLPGLAKPMEFQMKNCSNHAMCDQGMFCASANASVNGGLKDCHVSCCLGNLCNADVAMKTTTSTKTAAATTEVGGTTAGGKAAPTVSSATTRHILTGLTCFSAVISYFYFIVMA